MLRSLAKEKEILLTSSMVDSAEAEKLGLVCRVVNGIVQKSAV
jgi:enoyl-CoA hydratase/carnithine racemase